MDGAPGHEIRKVLPVPNSTGFQRKRFSRLAVGGNDTAGQQLDRLCQRGLARVVGPHEDGQRSEFQLDPPSVSLVPFESYLPEFHGRPMITV